MQVRYRSSVPLDWKSRGGTGKDRRQQSDIRLHYPKDDKITHSDPSGWREIAEKFL